MQQAAKKKLYYFNSKERFSIYDFCNKLTSLLEEKNLPGQEIVLLCIGSDRATGDCLGPIIGYKLMKWKLPNLHVYGTLAEPVHAKNLASTIAILKKRHKKATIIAVDASLGTNRHIGYITLGEGSLCPGIGVDKQLPEVGDIFITGIVNISGVLNHALLQTTRLDIVMQLADFICSGIRYSMLTRKQKLHN